MQTIERRPARRGGPGFRALRGGLRPGTDRDRAWGLRGLQPAAAQLHRHQATGDFAKQFHEKQNEILVQIAKAEPTKGTPLAAGVERWNDDGSANVMVATDISSKTPDGKQKIEATNRWVVTAQREGNQWKISSMQQVI